MSIRVVNDIKTEFIADNDGYLHEVKTQDVEPIIKEAKYLKDMHGGVSPDKEVWLMARIPMLVWHEWIIKYGRFFDRDEKLVRKLVNDYNYSKFRIHEGKM